MAVLQTETQVDKKKKLVRNAAIIFISVIVLLTFFSKTINNFLLPEVELGNATARTFSKEISAQGEVVPLNTETINSFGNWKITDVKVKEGDYVKKGDILALVDQGDIQLAIKRAELNLLKLESDLKLYKNGFQSVDLEQYKEDVKVAQKAVEKAEKKLKDQKDLYAKEAVTLESVNEAEEQLEIANRDYTDKKRLLSQKEKELKNSGDNYQTTVKEKEAEIELCRLELENSKKNISADGAIKSPVTGTIKSISIKKGDTTSSGQTLFDIVKEETGVAVKWTLDSKASSQAEKKDEVIVTTLDADKLEFNGAVNEKKYLASEGVYQFTTEIKDDEKLLTIGQKVDVTIRKKGTPYMCTVPNSSVITAGGNSYVYVLKTKDGIMGEENYVEQVSVSVLESDDFNSALSNSSITSDDKIVVFSSKPLSNKIQVKLR